MGQSKMDNPKKLATQVTQDEEKQNKNTTQYVLAVHVYLSFISNVKLFSVHWINTIF
jgi:hypothetical protein